MRARSTYERCCDVLEVPHGAPMDEIERSFRELIKVWHPDRFLDNPQLQIRATRKTSEITRAFQWLRRHEAARGGETPAPSNVEPVLVALRAALSRFCERHPGTPQELIQRAVRGLYSEVSTPRPSEERFYPFAWLEGFSPRRALKSFVARKGAILAWSVLILMFLFFGAR